MSWREAMTTAARSMRRLQWRLHRLLWEASGGRLGGRVLGMPVLELITIGHRSGEPRSVLLTYMETESGPALAGSNAGAASDPAWVENLRRYPDAEIRCDGRNTAVRARFLEGDEYQEVWGRFAAAYSGYRRYRRAAPRPIPLMVLEEKD